MHRLGRNIRWGVTAGLAMAAYYTAIALLIYAFRGDAPFQALGATLARTLAAYWVGGLVGGVLIGVALPIAKNVLGRIILGILVAIPAFTAISMAIDKFDWIIVMICAVFFGTVGGVALSNTGGPTWDELSDAEDGLDSAYLDNTDREGKQR